MTAARMRQTMKACRWYLSRDFALTRPSAASRAMTIGSSNTTPRASRSISTSDSCSLMVSSGRVQASSDSELLTGSERLLHLPQPRHRRALAAGRTGEERGRLLERLGGLPQGEPDWKASTASIRFSSDWRSAGAAARPSPSRVASRSRPSASSRACSSTTPSANRSGAETRPSPSAVSRCISPSARFAARSKSPERAKRSASISTARARSTRDLIGAVSPLESRNLNIVGSTTR